MNRKLKIALYIIIALLIIVLGAGIWYVNDYYHADASVDSLLNGTDNVSVVKIDNGLFLDGPGNDTALIFYPGAKVEYTSYLPLFMNLSADGVDCFLVEMPFNIAFLGTDSADSIINSDAGYNYSNWYMSGHSLGGVAASTYASGHSDTIKGLIFLAAYPTSQLNNLSVLSIYGSNDQVLNKNSYNGSMDFMPENFTEKVIEGGNHAQFASYGIQSGDGQASISEYEQKKQTINYILDFINS